MDDDTNIKLEGTTLYFYDEINEKTSLQFITLLQQAERAALHSTIDNGTEPIVTLYVNSPGGSIFDVWSMIDAVQNCRVHVRSIVTGYAASAGALLALSADSRYIMPNAYMLIHSVSTGFWGDHEDLEDEVRIMRMLRQQMRKYVTKHTNLSKQTIKEYMKRNWWLDAKTALKDGFVEGVVK